MIALRRFWIQITSDKRRFGALVAAVAIGILLWARVIIVSNPPQRAVADPKTKAQAQEGTNRSAASSDSRKLESVPIRLASDLSRDPFLISPKHFPKPTLPANSTGSGTKSTVVTAEDIQRAEALRTAQLKALADRISLEAVMTGGQLAVIDGRTIRVGDAVPVKSETAIAFTLVEVRHRAVILECEGRLFELQMPSATGAGQQ